MTNRREFLQASAVLGSMGVASALGMVRPAQAATTGEGIIHPGDTILFQGDSITDAGRSRETAGEPNQHSALGNGYVWMAASQILVDNPDANLKIFNRGISGHKVPNLAARWDKDTVAIKPDVLSILIGVNDIWHKRNGRYDGTLESYESGYRELLQKTVEALPDVKLVICEPFVLECGAVNAEFVEEMVGYRAVAKKMSEEFKTLFVPFQAMFDRALAYAEPKAWAGDGVHPTSAGAALMAHEWQRVVGGVQA